MRGPIVRRLQSLSARANGGIVRESLALGAPFSFLPASVNLSSPFRSDLSTSTSASGAQNPRSHSMTVPPPSFGDGAFEIAVVERMILDLRGEALVCQGPLVTAQDLKTPSCSRRRS